MSVNFLELKDKFISALYKELPVLTPHPRSLKRILSFAETFKAHRADSIIDQLFGWVREGFVFRWAPAMVVAFMAISLTLSVVSSPTKPEGSVATSFLLQNPTQALRDRLLTNPFDTPVDEFRLQGGGGILGIRKVALEEESLEASVPSFSLNELEKIYQQRHKTLLETDADSLMMRGRRLKAMGNLELALKDFETIYYFYPEYTYMSDVLMYRAQCYSLLGDFALARESLEEILKKNPSKKEIVQPLLEQLSR